MSLQGKQRAGSGQWLAKAKARRELVGSGDTAWDRVLEPKLREKHPWVDSTSDGMWEPGRRDWSGAGRYVRAHVHGWWDGAATLTRCLLCS